jgi:hypothetical protein
MQLPDNLSNNQPSQSQPQQPYQQPYMPMPPPLPQDPYSSPTASYYPQPGQIPSSPPPPTKKPRNKKGCLIGCGTIVLLIFFIGSCNAIMSGNHSPGGTASITASPAVIATMPPQKTAEATKLTTIPTASSPSKPTQPPIKPTVEPPIPTLVPTQPPVQPTQPPAQPTQPPVQPTQPPVQPTQPPAQPTQPPVQPTQPPVQPTQPPVQPTQPPACQAVNGNPWCYNFTAAGGTVITSPPAAFCSGQYFSCIPNFVNGVGHVEECVDGLYSLSGGQPGSCSRHGGNLAILYSH